MVTALPNKVNINEQTDDSISSLVESWLLLKDIEVEGERNKGLYVIKSRGMSPKDNR